MCEYEPLPGGNGKREIVVSHQYVGMLVEYVAIAARIFRIYFAMIAIDHHHADAALGGGEQRVMDGQ